MAQTVVANKLTISHKGTMGMEMCSAPDVCKTPAAPSPIPIPYMIVSKSSTLTGGTTTVDADGGNSIAIMGSKHASCIGDQPGSVGGVASGVFGQASEWITFSPNVTANGKAICRLSDKLTMNNKNTVAGPGGHMVLPAAVKDPVEQELCDIFCRARADWLAKRRAKQKVSRPSKLAEDRVNAALKDENSPLSQAIKNKYPEGSAGAAERTYYVPAPASFAKGANASGTGRQVMRKGSVRNAIDRRMKRAAADNFPKGGKAAPVSEWQQRVPGLNNALKNKKKDMTAAEVREALKAPGAVADTNIKVKPDFSVMDKNGNPKDIYDFKFDDPKGGYQDTFQKGQKQEAAYKKATGKKPKVIDAKKCGCRPKSRKAKSADKAAKGK